jgi:hypothetical protein
VRWDALFADLEAQADALAAAERAAEVDERARIELGAVSWRRRLQAALGAPVQLRCTGGAQLRGRVGRVGPDWTLIDDGGREALVALAAVLGVAGLSRYADVEETSPVASKLSLRSALRGVARDRSVVRIRLIGADAALDGTIDRVGADFVDLAEHAAGEPRRRGEVRGTVLVPVSAIAVVHRQH